MFRVARALDFCYGHRLLRHAGKCRYLHGHNAHAVIVLQSEQLDEQGMVMDFGDIKQRLGRWIGEHLDHRMILERDDPAVVPLQSQGEPVYVLDCPPTAENLAKLLHDIARAQGLPVVEVQLWETPECSATYRSTVRE